MLCWQVGHGDTVLAGEVLQSPQPLVEAIQFGRVGFDVIAQPFQLRLGFISLDRRGVEQFADRCQSWFVFALAGQFGGCLAQCPRRRRGVIGAELAQGSIVGSDQACGMGLAAMRRFQRGQLHRVQRVRIEFGNLVFKPINAFDRVFGPLHLAQFASHGRPAPREQQHGFDIAGMPAKSIEQLQLPHAVEQRLVFVLAVDLQQMRAQGTQLGQRRRPAIDPRARAAVGAYDTAQLAIAVFVEFMFAQPGQGQRRVIQGKSRGQLGPDGAVTDHAGVGAGAGKRQQRVHQQGLAGPGLTGNHGHAALELQLGEADDGEIADGEVSEHGRQFCLNPAGATDGLRRRRVGRIYGVMSRPLDLRARRLLRTLISQHIRDGEPVGSRTLARQSGLDVSPATVRNIMADLEEIGLLSAPHSSAGRIPTAQGYRVFVDSLLQMQPLDELEIARLRSQMPVGAGTQALLSNASELLSAMSQFVGVVTVPQRSQFAFRMIDFVPIDGSRVLVILVFTDNEVQNRIITTRRPYSPGELEQVANYLNSNFAGRPLADIRSALLRDLRETRSELEQVLSAAVELAEQTLATGPEDMLLSGQTRMMGTQGISDVDRLRELFDAFARKREILALLERCTQAPGVRVFIGEESGLAPLDGCTIITAPYASQGRVLGVLGVIGPTRMAYDRVIPIVQATANLLGEALKTEASTP